MSGDGKGERLEELVRSYFDGQGYFALRAVPLRFEKQDVTDIDVWLYIRKAPSARIRGVVDIKDKQRSKAAERVLWTKGLQSLVGAERGIVVTRDTSPEMGRFARSQGLVLLDGSFINRVKKQSGQEDRLTLEQFEAEVRTYPAQKEDGNWIERIRRAKAGLANQPAFRTFNASISQFAYFAQRIESRYQHKELARRCALLCAALACVALDSAVDSLTYSDASHRFRSIVTGVAYGDADDESTQRAIDSALSLITDSVENGRSIASRARSNIERRLHSMRAELIAEFFSKEKNSSFLFSVAKELDRFAHARAVFSSATLSTEAKMVLGVFSDFVDIERRHFINVSQASPAPSEKRLLSEDVPFPPETAAPATDTKLL